MVSDVLLMAMWRVRNGKSVRIYFVMVVMPVRFEWMQVGAISLEKDAIGVGDAIAAPNHDRSPQQVDRHGGIFLVAGNGRVDRHLSFFFLAKIVELLHEHLEAGAGDSRIGPGHISVSAGINRDRGVRLV